MLAWIRKAFLVAVPVLAYVTVILLYVYCYQVKLELGHWPRSIFESPSRELQRSLIVPLVVLFAFLTVHAFPLWLVALLIERWETRSWKVTCLLFVWVPIAILLIEDPADLIEWFLD
jgi:hypothetical protein